MAKMCFSQGLWKEDEGTKNGGGGRRKKYKSSLTY